MLPDMSQLRTTGDAQSVAVKNKVLKTPICCCPPPCCRLRLDWNKSGFSFRRESINKHVTF